MKTTLLSILILFWVCVASAAVWQNAYTTTNTPAVDQHVLSLIGPVTNALDYACATITNNSVFVMYSSASPIVVTNWNTSVTNNFGSSGISSPDGSFTNFNSGTFMFVMNGNIFDKNAGLYKIYFYTNGVQAGSGIDQSNTDILSISWNLLPFSSSQIFTLPANTRCDVRITTTAGTGQGYSLDGFSFAIVALAGRVGAAGAQGPVGPAGTPGSGSGVGTPNAGQVANVGGVIQIGTNYTTKEIYGVNTFMVDPVVGNDSTPVNGFIYQTIIAAATAHPTNTTFLLQPGTHIITSFNLNLSNNDSLIGHGQQDTIVSCPNTPKGGGTILFGNNTYVSDIYFTNCIFQDNDGSGLVGVTNCTFKNLTFHDEFCRDVFLFDTLAGGIYFSTFQNLDIYAGWDIFSGVNVSLFNGVTVHEFNTFTNIGAVGAVLMSGFSELNNCTFYVDNLTGNSSPINLGDTGVRSLPAFRPWIFRNVVAYYHEAAGYAQTPSFLVPDPGTPITGDFFFSTNLPSVNGGGSRFYFSGSGFPYQVVYTNGAVQQTAVTNLVFGNQAIGNISGMSSSSSNFIPANLCLTNYMTADGRYFILSNVCSHVLIATRDTNGNEYVGGVITNASQRIDSPAGSFWINGHGLYDFGLGNNLVVNFGALQLQDDSGNVVLDWAGHQFFTGWNGAGVTNLQDTNIFYNLAVGNSFVTNLINCAFPFAVISMTTNCLVLGYSNTTFNASMVQWVTRVFTNASATKTYTLSVDTNMAFVENSYVTNIVSVPPGGRKSVYGRIVNSTPPLTNFILLP